MRFGINLESRISSQVVFDNKKNMEDFRKLIFRGMNCSDLEYFSKHFVCLRQNSQGITQNYQSKPSNEA